MRDDAHPAWAVYDLDRLRANLAAIRRRIGSDQACIAALKANAYGHGAVPVARALDGEGLAAFMTGSFDEACRLRAEGLSTPVVMFAARGLAPPVTQARASACVAAGLSDRANAVCVGHLLYGLSPFADASLADLSAYRPVLAEVGSRLIQVSDHPQGSDIAIGGSYGIRHSRRTGVAPIGVAQGLVRPVPGSRPRALVRGRRAPILAVSLEHMVLDLTDVEDAAVGDAVLLLGGEGDAAIGLDELAAWFGTTALDAVMALSGRLPAHYRDTAGGPP